MSVTLSSSFKFPFTLNIPEGNNLSLQELYSSGVNGVINDEVVLLLKQLESEAIPPIYKHGYYKSIIESLSSKVYPPEEQNVIGEHMQIGGLKFPSNSVVLDAISLLTYYPAFPCGEVDWTTAELVILDPIFILEIKNNEHELRMEVEFKKPRNPNNPIRFSNFNIIVYYYNLENEISQRIQLNRNIFTSGIENQLQNLTNFPLRNSDYGNFMQWSEHNPFIFRGLKLISLDYNFISPIVGTCTTFNFMNNPSCCYQPTRIEWKRSPTGETTHLEYNFDNYFPLFELCYPRNHFDSRPRKCLAQVAQLFNSDEMQNALHCLVLFAIPKRFGIEYENEVPGVGKVKIIQPIDKHLSLLPNELIAVIFSYLFPQIPTYYLEILIKYALQTMRK